MNNGWKTRRHEKYAKPPSISRRRERERQTEPEGKSYIKKYIGQVRLFNGARKVDEVMTLACISPSGAVPYVSKNRSYTINGA